MPATSADLANKMAEVNAILSSIGDNTKPEVIIALADMAKTYVPALMKEIVVLAAAIERTESLAGFWESTGRGAQATSLREAIDGTRQ